MIDLHAHTTMSDGTVTPTELIVLAKETGLSAVAITDHDSIEGHDEAQREADLLGITLIKGIEFDVRYGKGTRLHILGLGIDSKKEDFLEIYNRYRKGKDNAIDENLESLKEQGISLTRADILPYKVGEFLDRQAIAKYLVAEGYAPIMKNAWIDYLDLIPMKEQDLIDAKDAFDAIHFAGGKAYLAHHHIGIGLGDMSDEEALETLKDLKNLGLDGMEYYYPSYTQIQQAKCKSYVDQFGFRISGGSDFHGANRAHIKLGVGEGDFHVPDEVLKQL